VEPTAVTCLTINWFEWISTLSCTTGNGPFSCSVGWLEEIFLRFVVGKRRRGRQVHGTKILSDLMMVPMNFSGDVVDDRVGTEDVNNLYTT
jgi:hypothetical protein